VANKLITSENPKDKIKGFNLIGELKLSDETGNFMGRNITQILLSSLSSHNIGTKIEAIEALGKMKDYKIVDELISIVLRSNDNNLHEVGVRAIKKMRSTIESMIEDTPDFNNIGRPLLDKIDTTIGGLDKMKLEEMRIKSKKQQDNLLNEIKKFEAQENDLINEVMHGKNIEDVSEYDRKGGKVELVYPMYVKARIIMVALIRHKAINIASGQKIPSIYLTYRDASICTELENLQTWAAAYGYKTFNLVNYKPPIGIWDPIYIYKKLTGEKYIGFAHAYYLVSHLKHISIQGVIEREKIKEFEGTLLPSFDNGIIDFKKFNSIYIEQLYKRPSY
jgi:hypothetical protein